MNQDPKPYGKPKLNQFVNSLFFTSILFLLGLGACSPDLPEIPGFNRILWLDDPGGCKNQRAEYYQLLSDNKSKLIGLTEKEVNLLLGKPDEKELYQRGQWFYLYYLHPGPTCATGSSRENTARVQFRISALGKVSEVIFRKP